MVVDWKSQLCIYIYIYICIIVHDNVANEGFCVLDYL